MVTNNAANNKTGASGTILQGQGVGTASDFSTATYPATTTINQLLYSSSANTVAGLATANSAILATNSSGVPSITTASGNWINTSRTCFFAYQSSAINNVTGDGTTYTLVYGNLLFDQASNFNISTGIFTAPVTGHYLVTCSVSFGNIGAGHTSGIIQLSGTFGTFELYRANPTNAAVSGNVTWGGSAIILLNATNTCGVTLTVAGSTKTISFGIGVTCTFTGTLLC